MLPSQKKKFTIEPVAAVENTGSTKLHFSNYLKIHHTETPDERNICNVRNQAFGYQAINHSLLLLQH